MFTKVTIQNSRITESFHMVTIGKYFKRHRNFAAITRKKKKQLRQKKYCYLFRFIMKHAYRTLIQKKKNSLKNKEGK